MSWINCQNYFVFFLPFLDQRGPSIQSDFDKRIAIFDPNNIPDKRPRINVWNRQTSPLNVQKWCLDIGLTLVQISEYHFFGGGQLISKFKVWNCTSPGGGGPPEPNFVNKLESTSIRIYEDLIV